MERRLGGSVGRVAGDVNFGGTVSSKGEDLADDLDIAAARRARREAVRFEVKDRRVETCGEGGFEVDVANGGSGVVGIEICIAVGESGCSSQRSAEESEFSRPGRTDLEGLDAGVAG